MALTQALQWQHHNLSNFAAFSGIPLDVQDAETRRYDTTANAEHQMVFDVHSPPVRPGMLFDTEAWPLCYRYLA